MNINTHRIEVSFLSGKAVISPLTAKTIVEFKTREPATVDTKYGGKLEAVITEK